MLFLPLVLLSPSFEILTFPPTGILREDGTLDNAASCNRLGEVALAYARAGESLVLSFSQACG